MAKNETLESNKKQSEVKYIKPEIGSGFITPPPDEAKQQETASKEQKDTK